MTNQAAADLIARSNRLGADPKNTNYAGGNTSAKGTETDPVTGEPVELLWVKGSGGDLGTLTEAGPRGAAPRPACARSSTSTRASTARTRWSPRSTTACTARAAPRRRSTRRCTASSMPRTSTTCTPTRASRSRPPPTARSSPRRSSATRSCGCRGVAPGFQLGLDIAAIKAQNPQAIGCILGGHGITAWGDTSEEAEAQLALDHRDRRRRTSTRTARPSPFGTVRDGFAALPEPTSAARRPPRSRRRSAASPRTTSPMVGHFTDDPTRARLPRLGEGARSSPRSARAAPTTSCAPRSSRCCSTCPPTRRSRSRSPA